MPEVIPRVVSETPLGCIINGMKLVVLSLTCANEAEGAKLTHALLDKKLVICIKQFSVNSTYLWKGKKETASEVMLLMETHENHISQIEKEIRKLHSYGTFVLLAYPVIYATSRVKKWIKNEI